MDTIRRFSISQGDRIAVSASGFGARSTNDFSYNANSGGLFFGNQQFAILSNRPGLSSVARGFVLT